MMVVGLIIIIFSFGLSRIFEEYSVWFMAIGFPIGLKNKHIGEE